MSTRRVFEEELQTLRNDMMKMASEVEFLFEQSIDAIVSRNEKLANEVIIKGNKIDQMEIKIQDRCIKLLIHQQPLASDLRLITAILKMITDLERIGDHCEDICMYSLKIKDEIWTHEEAYQRHIEKMANDVRKMLTMSIDGFLKQDLESMQEVCEADDSIDEEFIRIWKEIVNEMKSRQDFISKGAYYIMIIKYLERMADHVTNIAEWMLYHITGEYNNDK